MKKILVYGYYGINNTGDDFIMLSLLNTLKNPYYKITVLSGKSNYKELVLNNNVDIKVLPSNKIIRNLFIMFQLIKHHYFIVGGGGLWPNDSIEKVFVNFIWMVTCKFFHTKCVFYGIELTKIRNKTSKHIWKKIIHNVDWIFTRNENSMNILNKISFSKKTCAYSDITFSLSNKELDQFSIQTKQTAQVKKLGGGTKYGV